MTVRGLLWIAENAVGLMAKRLASIVLITLVDSPFVKKRQNARVNLGGDGLTRGLRWEGAVWNRFYEGSICSLLRQARKGAARGDSSEGSAFADVAAALVQFAPNRSEFASGV